MGVCLKILFAPELNRFCMIMCVCVCVREKERGREQNSLRLGLNTLIP